MDSRKKRLPDAELEVMQAVWRQTGPVTSGQVWEELKDSRGWALTTVLGFLTRLVERGFLSVEKAGRSNWYTPLVQEAEYRLWEGENLLSRMYHSSVTSFVASLYDGGSLEEKDLMELRQFLEEHSGKGESR